MSPANKYGASIDLFAFCLTQFGLGEMRNLIEKTGGLVMNEEEFDTEVYEKCLLKYMETITSENAIYNAQIKTFCSKELYLSGMIGPG